MAHFNTLVTEADSLVSSMRQHILENYDFDSSSTTSSSSTDTAEEKNDESKDV